MILDYVLVACVTVQ